MITVSRQNKEFTTAALVTFSVSHIGRELRSCTLCRRSLCTAVEHDPVFNLHRPLALGDSRSSNCYGVTPGKCSDAVARFVTPEAVDLDPGAVTIESLDVIAKSPGADLTAGTKSVPSTARSRSVSVAKYSAAAVHGWDGCCTRNYLRCLARDPRILLGRSASSVSPAACPVLH